MGKFVKYAMCMAVLLSGTVLMAQDGLSEQKKAQNKLLAYRAARADAMRKIAERVKGLKITSETTVKDFVTESDKVNTQLSTFLVGARETDKPKYNEDGTCELTMEITLETVIADLKQIRETYCKGSKIKVKDFEQITVHNEFKVIKETGTGAPRPEFADNAGEFVPVKDTLESTDNMGAAKAYWMAHVMPQGRLMAVRAARVDGMRKLAERIKGVAINSKTSVADFVTESDDVKVSMETFLKGAREKSIRYHEDELIVDVEMEVTLRTVYASLKQWSETHYKGDKVKIKELEELTTRTEDKIIKETGNGIPPAKFTKDLTEKQVTALEQKAPDWAGRTIVAVGTAAIDKESENATQAKLMAYRGAELDARRKIAEELNGLAIDSKTKVEDFVATSDVIKTKMIEFQQGAHVVEGSQKELDDGTVQIKVELDLAPLWTMVNYYQKKAPK